MSDEGEMAKKACKYLETRFDMAADLFTAKCLVHGSKVTRQTGEGWPVNCREPGGARRPVSSQSLPMRPMR